MRKVNFFIAGAPKSGTSALSEYLKQHPQVCFSNPKETGFFDEFLKGFSGSEEDYFNYFFTTLTPNHIAIGEGSVWYLYSQKAFENIKRYNPEAKIIIMLRNPVDMIYSLHSQLLYNFIEDVKDFKQAWLMQEGRKSGNNIPKGCKDPALLQYSEIGLYSKQTKRLKRIIPAEQTMIILFDDFVNYTEKVYSQVLSFLNLDQDERQDFPKINENKLRRSYKLGRLTTSLGRFFKYRAFIRKILHKAGIRILPLLDRLNTKKIKRRPLDPEMRSILIEAFRKDILELSTILERDLSHWLK